MTKIQLGSGAASSTSHHLTQSSQAIDRRNVVRPSNLAIEEAARSATYSRAAETSSARPSRLVNLRVHAADLLQAQAETPVEEAPAAPVQQVVVPKVVELGTIDRRQVPDELPVAKLTDLVPQEAPVEEITNFTPAVVAPAASTQNTMMPAATQTTVDPKSLEMSIAADYASANLGAVEANHDSIDTIAQATSEAIAAIRAATNPEEIADQVASLQAFAENLKASSAAPEMIELSNTIDKFISVAMKSTKVQEEVQKKSAAKRAEQETTVKVAPKKVPSAVAKPAARVTAPARRTAKALPHTIHAAAQPRVSRPASRRVTHTAPKLVADEDQALRNALKNVVAMDDEPKSASFKHATKRRGGGKRLVLAFFCAILCVGIVAYFVGSSIPDISVKVAAIQTGIEASYPSYIPRDYSLSDINSEDGKITMTFKGPERAGFTLTEEKSSWDSTALLRNYVEPTWQSNYITTHEQGITIYISGANAAWVNGGVLYKINDTSNSLTKKQLRNIVISL